MICDAWSVVVVPFPFAERAGAKRRPALVLSNERFNHSNGHTIMAMITMAARTRWPSDVVLADWQAAGLKALCVVRPKVFTLENSLVVKSLGVASKRDRSTVKAMLRKATAL